MICCQLLDFLLEYIVIVSLHSLEPTVAFSQHDSSPPFVSPNCWLLCRPRLAAVCQRPQLLLYFPLLLVLLPIARLNTHPPSCRLPCSSCCQCGGDLLPETRKTGQDREAPCCKIKYSPPHTSARSRFVCRPLVFMECCFSDISRHVPHLPAVLDVDP